MSIWSRLLNRTAAKPAVRMFEGASGRRWSNVPAFGATGAEVLAGAPQVRGRARHLRHNDAHAGNAVEIFKTGLVGYGVTAAAVAEDDAARDTHTKQFAAWVEATNFAALQVEMIDALVADGESLIVLRVSDDGRLELQHVPSEQLDESYSVELSGGRYIAAGIEYDAQDRLGAYHFRPARPTDQFQTYRAPLRVDATDVIHIFRRQGAGQTRGMSWLAPVILALNEKGQLKDALLVNAKIQSMLVGFITDQNGTGTSPFEDGEIPDLSLEPGTMRVLPQGFDVKFSSPQQMTTATEVANQGIREIAAGLQTPSSCCRATCGA